MVAPQPEPVSRPPGIPVSREAHSQLQPGLKKPETEPRMAAESAQLDSPARPALPAVPEEESAELALAVVKEESLRSSPAWKVRAAREAAQHTGNTLFADICQPGTVPASACNYAWDISCMQILVLVASHEVGVACRPC